MRYTFKYSERLHLYEDFQRVLKQGRRLAHPAILIYIYRLPQGQSGRRMGLITSGKIGIAVERNRVKRRLREIFRLNKNRFIEGLDIIFMARRGAVALSYKELETVILGLLQKAGFINATNDKLP